MSAGPEIVVEAAATKAPTAGAPRGHITALLVLWAVVSLPVLAMGFHADDWFHLRPRAPAEVLATFAGDWNSGVRGAGGFHRPLARVSLSLDSALWGRLAAGPHATSALAFLAVILAVHAVALQLTGGRRRCALAAAALVAASPLKSEALYWISARGDLLAAAFGLWALHLALRGVEHGGVRNVAASLALLLAALLSKEVAVAFVVVIPAAVLLLRQPVPWTRGDVALVLLPPAIGAAWLCFRASVLGGVGGYYAVRAEPLALPEMLSNMGRMLSALALPGTAFATGHWVPGGGALWLATTWFLMMASRLRRTYLLCALGVLASLAPMAGLPVSPADGTRVLLVGLCFQALFAGSVFAQFAAWRVARFVGAPVLVAVVFVHSMLSLARAEDFVSARGPNERVMREAAARIASAKPGERFLLPDPPDPAGQSRYLAPGMSLLMAMQAESARLGAPAQLDGVELLPGPPRDATTATLVLLEAAPDGTLRESRYAALASRDLTREAAALLPSGHALRETIARVPLAPLAPAGLQRVTMLGRGEQPIAPRVECRGLDDHLAGSAVAMLSHAHGDEWEMTAHIATREPFGTLVVAPTATPRRFTLLGVTLDTHPPIGAPAN